MTKLIILSIDPQNIDPSEFVRLAFEQFRAIGVEEFSLDEPRVDELLGARAYSGGDVPVEVIDEIDQTIASDTCNRYKVYFENDSPGLQDCIDQCQTWGLQFEVQELADQDWDAEWRKTYSAFEVTEDLWIIPEWEKENYKGEKYLYVYPGQGFGTGKHETTFLCLKIYSELKRSDFASCLDFGCGSGILGCAVLKKSPRARIIFCDIDKAALDNTVQNLSLNFSGLDLSSCTVVVRDRLVLEKHNLVFANILLSALVDEKHTIDQSLNRGGLLIASGILAEQRDEFLNSYRDYKLLQEERKSDWMAFLLEKQ
jgi:ribosomal protein L11 methyltransferase